jgi:hypothetical protein
MNKLVSVFWLGLSAFLISCGSGLDVAVSEKEENGHAPQTELKGKDEILLDHGCTICSHVVTFMPPAEPKTSVCTGNSSLLAAQPFARGSGTSEDPYGICTIDQLQALADSPEDYENSHFELLSSLDFESTLFNMIGSMDHPFNGSFNGSFNGNGYSIKNIIIYAEEEPRDNNNDAGFFRMLESDAHISNLVLVNASVFGRVNTGILAGQSNGSIESIYVSGIGVARRHVGGVVGLQSGGKIKEAVVSVAVMATEGPRVGGVVGHLTDQAELEAAQTEGRVFSADRYSGGLVGLMDGQSTLRQSKSDMEIWGKTEAGGAVGQAEEDAWIDGVEFTGYIRADQRMGGIVGFLTQSRLTNSHVRGSQIEGYEYAGGIAGRVSTSELRYILLVERSLR